MIGQLRPNARKKDSEDPWLGEDRTKENQKCHNLARYGYGCFCLW